MRKRRYLQFAGRNRTGEKNETKQINSTEEKENYLQELVSTIISKNYCPALVLVVALSPRIIVKNCLQELSSIMVYKKEMTVEDKLEQR